MKLMDLISRGVAGPWVEGDTIPWNDPDFSQRMLKEHLSQEHDAASRRLETVDRHVRFIHEQVLGGRAARILDLGCGPGLYSHRLARLGHTIRGIDYSPASIEYARQVAESEGLDCSYTLSDIRQADFGPESDRDLVMLIFGEFNVFRPADVQVILHKSFTALKPGGKLLLEPSNDEMTRQIGAKRSGWYSAETGLFSARPHLLLEESFWDETCKVSTKRFILIDAETAEVTRYAASYQVYTQADLTAVLEAAGFCSVRFYPSLTGEAGGDFWAVTAERSR